MTRLNILTLTTKSAYANLLLNMGTSHEIVQPSNTTKRPFWRGLFNLKVLFNTEIVWAGLFSQDIYAMLHWIPTEYYHSSFVYFRRWFITLVLLYIVFLTISYLVKRPSLKSLYHKKIAYIALAIWFVMNVSCYQLLYFKYSFRLRVYLLKLLHLFALYALVLIITRLIQQRHDPKIKQQLIFTSIFSVIGWLFLLLTYPGAWKLDDIGILNQAGNYGLSQWQHMFSGIFHILCLQTIPFTFGVIFIQVLLNAMLFGYCVVALANIFSKSFRQILILEIILSFAFVLPPVLNYTLSGFRIGIYQFLELYLLTRLIVLFYHKEHKVSWLNLIEITFFTIIIGTWRTEGFIYPFVVLAALLLLGKDRLKRTWQATAGIALIGVLGCNMYNAKLIGNNEEYTIVSTFVPVCAIIREADDLDEETLTILNKIIDIEFVKANDAGAHSYKWYYTNGGHRSNYSQAEARAYLFVAAKIILQHPQIAIDQWSTNFQKTVWINAKRKTIPSSLIRAITSFSKTPDNQYWFNNEYFPYINNSYFYKPINSTLRNQVIAWITGIKLDDNTFEENQSYQVTPAYHVFYNLVIPLILFSIAMMVIILCRQWFLLLPCAAILCHLAIVFCTAPGIIFFYYLPIYFCMYVFAIAIIWHGAVSLINKFHKKINH